MPNAVLPSFSRSFYIGVGLLLPLAVASGAGAAGANFRAGAARVEITPAANAVPAPFKTVLDQIYVRAIVLDDGSTDAAIVTMDARNLEDDMWAGISARVATESGISLEHLIVSATHSHSTPQTRLNQQPGGPLPPTPKDANNQAYRINLSNAVVEAVRQAKSRLQPSRVGYGTGLAYINVNRDWFNPKDQHWYLYQPYQGVNTSGPSDKRVYVFRFDSLSGEPIAIYCNYAVHADFNNGATAMRSAAMWPGSQRDTWKTITKATLWRFGRQAPKATNIPSTKSGSTARASPPRKNGPLRITCRLSLAKCSDKR